MKLYKYSKDYNRGLLGIPAYEVDAWIEQSNDEDKKSCPCDHVIVSTKPINTEWLEDYSLLLISNVTLERQRNELLKKSSLSKDKRMMIVMMQFDNIDQVKEIINKYEGASL